MTLEYCHISDRVLGKTQRIMGKMGDITVTVDTEPEVSVEVDQRIQIYSEPGHTLAIRLTSAKS